MKVGNQQNKEANNMEFITSKQAEKERRKLNSGWSDETKLNQRILVSILNKLEKPVNIEKLLKRIEKLERDLDFYIKEYPEQIDNLGKKEDGIPPTNKLVGILPKIL